MMAASAGSPTSCGVARRDMSRFRGNGRPTGLVAESIQSPYQTWANAPVRVDQATNSTPGLRDHLARRHTEIGLTRIGYPLLHQLAALQQRTSPDLAATNRLPTLRVAPGSLPACWAPPTPPVRPAHRNPGHPAEDRPRRSYVFDVCRSTGGWATRSPLTPERQRSRRGSRPSTRRAFSVGALESLHAMAGAAQIPGA